MPDYPTLSNHGDIASFIEQPLIDPTIRNPKESGAVLTRARFTAVAKMWSYTLRALTDADKALLESLESSVAYGASTFNWTRPGNVGGGTYVVRFGKPLLFSVDRGVPGRWRCPIVLIEANPS